MGGIQYYIMPNNNNKSSNGGRKNGNGKSRKSKTKMQMQGVQNFRGITQSVALSVNNAFGDSPKTATLAKGLDAFDSCHVPLPRAIGDYSVVRTTQILSGTEALRLFGPVTYNSTSDPGGDKWSSIACISSVAPGTAINAANNAKNEVFDVLGDSSWDHVRMTPAAFSVQIMNPEALQTTSGIVYVGRAKQQLNIGGSTRTWTDLANELVSYSNPRLCAAGKLALRGVQTDAVPYDMQSISDFRQLVDQSNGNFTLDTQIFAHDGFAPIFVYNPNGIDLQFLVCCEWRVRFDPANPAYATHTYHRPSTMGYWDRLQQFASSLGPGVLDIAEKAAPYLLNYAMQGPASRLRLTNE